MRRRTIDDEGVATAIGAVMLIVIMFVALVVFQTSFVPQWEEQAEAEHARLTQGQMVALLGTAQQRSANVTGAAVSLVMTMDDGTDFLFASGAEIPGEVGFVGGAGIHASADELIIARRDGTSLAAWAEEWVAITSAQTVGDISQIDHLRLRIYDPEDGSDGDAVHLQIIDGDGNLAALMTTYIDRYPSGYAIRVAVSDDEGNVLVDTGESRFQQDQPPLVWVDAMEREYLLRSLVAGAKTPLTLHIDPDGLDADFTIQGTSVNGGPITPGAGALVTDYEEFVAGKSFTVHHKNQRFPDQKLSIDHGAIVLVQPDGAAFLVEPDFTFGTMQGGGATAQWSDVLFDNPGQSLATKRPVHIVLGGTEVTDIQATAPAFAWNITTPYPSLWADWLDRQAEAAQWDSGSGHYTITEGLDWVRLELLGPSAGTDHDLSLRWRHATISTTINQ